jgi:rod shape-determining protein MreD
MLRSVILFLWLVAVLLLQFTILPSYFEDPYKPNLVIIFVSWLALRQEFSVMGGLCAYVLGLIHGTFSGIYFGLAGISMLVIYLLLKAVADQLYTESANLMIIAVFAASLVDALLSILLLLLFSTETGFYHSFFANMIPQAVITAFAAFLVFTVSPIVARRFFW